MGQLLDQLLDQHLLVASWGQNPGPPVENNEGKDSIAWLTSAG